MITLSLPRAPPVAPVPPLPVMLTALVGFAGACDCLVEDPRDSALVDIPNITTELEDCVVHNDTAVFVADSASMTKGTCALSVTARRVTTTAQCVPSQQDRAALALLPSSSLRSVSWVLEDLRVGQCSMMMSSLSGDAAASAGWWWSSPSSTLALHGCNWVSGWRLTRRSLGAPLWF